MNLQKRKREEEEEEDDKEEEDGKGKPWKELDLIVGYLGLNWEEKIRREN